MSRARYRWSDHNGSKRGTRPEQVNRVFRAVRDRVNDSDRGYIYIKSSDIQLEMANDVIGRCLTALRDCEHCPLNIEMWSGENNPPAVWLVERGGRDA